MRKISKLNELYKMTMIVKNMLFIFDRVAKFIRVKKDVHQTSQKDDSSRAN